MTNPYLDQKIDCKRCGTSKFLRDFGKNTATPTGYQPWCRRCTRGYVLRKKYGINSDDYDRILRDQHGGCAICGKLPDKRSLAVDHDHKTLAMRGLLCPRCNQGLGYFGDTAEGLRKAADYLARPPAHKGLSK